MKADDLIQSWLIKASHDLGTAKLVSDSLPDYDDTIAFHCQQAIEKTLKAYLIYLDIEFKAVHDLGYLMNLIGTKDKSLEDLYNQVDEISRYAVQIRYPDGTLELSKHQIEEAIALAETVFLLVNSKLTK